MSASHAAGPPAMLRLFFNSCFQKRSDRLPGKSAHQEGATETDSSHVTLEPLQTSSHSLPSQKHHIPVSANEETETHSQPAQRSSTNPPTMPRPVKEKSASKARKSANNRKPYLRVQQALGSDPRSVFCRHIFLPCSFKIDGKLTTRLFVGSTMTQSRALSEGRTRRRDYPSNLL
jgi:hypothetical protein